MSHSRTTATVNLPTSYAGMIHNSTSRHECGRVCSNILQVFVILFYVASGICFGSCGIDWVPPDSHFANVDDSGFISYWEPLCDVAFDSTVSIPIAAYFSSRPEGKSQFLRSGWSVPFLDSTLSQVEENTLMLIQPDGKVRHFRRADTSVTEFESQGGWVAHWNGLTAEVRSDCGWSLRFRNARLTELRYPSGRTISFVRLNDGTLHVREGITVHIEVVFHKPGTFELKTREGAHIVFSENTGAATDSAEDVSDLQIYARNELVRSQQFKVQAAAANRVLQIGTDSNPTNFLGWESRSGFAVLANGKDFIVSADRGSKIAITAADTSGIQQSWAIDRVEGLETTLHSGEWTFRRFVTEGLNTGKTKSIQRQVGESKVKMYSAEYGPTGYFTRELFPVDGVSIVYGIKEPGSGAKLTTPSSTVDISFDNLTGRIISVKQTSLRK